MSEVEKVPCRGTCGRMLDKDEYPRYCDSCWRDLGQEYAEEEAESRHANQHMYGPDPDCDDCWED